MTLDEIKTRVEKIRKSAADDERAHGMEDELRSDFIAFIAKTEGGALAEMAEEILKTDNFAFARWCA